MPKAKKGTGFQQIENYGVIGNMRSIALVSVEGSIDFLCFPNFDSPTIFAALLDPKRGVLQPESGSGKYALQAALSSGHQYPADALSIGVGRGGGHRLHAGGRRRE